MMAPDSASPSATNSAREDATVRDAVRWSRMPMACPSCTVQPMVSPEMMPVMVCMVMLPVDTADTCAASANKPTTIRSTVPYMACSRLAPIMGRAKSSSFFHTLPSVSECSFIRFLRF